MITFLELPTELRLQILRYSIPEEVSVEIMFKTACISLPGGSKCKNPALPLLLVYSKLHSEVETIPPSIPCLNVDYFVFLTVCLYKCSSKIMNDLRRVRVNTRYSSGIDFDPSLDVRTVLEAQAALEMRLHRRLLKDRTKEILHESSSITSTLCGEHYDVEVVWELGRGDNGDDKYKSAGCEDTSDLADVKVDT